MDQVAASANEHESETRNITADVADSADGKTKLDRDPICRPGTPQAHKSPAFAISFDGQADPALL